MHVPEEKESDLSIDYSERPKTPFTIDQVKMIWKQYAFQMKDIGADTIYYALTKRDPKIINENEIHQNFDNQVQIDMIQHHLSDFIEFIRNKLNNWSVQLFFDINTQQEEDIRLLTGKDKFDALAKKNVNLYSFQKTFNLDIDY